MVKPDLMKRVRRPFAWRSTFLIALSTSILLGPGGLASLAWGSCPDARFAQQVVVPAGGAVEGISVADFNGDGDLDLAVTNFSSGGAALNGVSILLGDGAGGLGAPTSFGVGRGATRIVASDFNGDGQPDVAVLNANDGTVSILLGDGFGGLGPQAAFPAGGATVGLALGDFDDDGNSDLVVTDFFAARVTVLLGRGDGSFSAPTPFPVGADPLLVAVGDVDADGALDIAVDNVLDETVSVLLGRGDGTFAPQTVVPVPLGFGAESLALADLDRDGIADMVVASASDDSVLVFLGHGDGSFDVPAAFAAGGLPVFFAVGDFNNDGLSDLAVGNAQDATVSVLLGRGDGSLGRPTPLAVGSGPIPVAIADLDGDGSLDIVAGNTADQTVSVLMNQCAGNLPPIADAGGDQVLECTGDLEAKAQLDGSGSTDPDSTLGSQDDIASFLWSEQGAPLTTERSDGISLGLGTHEVSLEVTDRSGAASSDGAIITVEDTTVPAIDSIVATPGTLSPPNREFVQVTINAVATDGCDPAPTCRIVSVTDNEPISGIGGGPAGPDSVIIDPGPKPSPARLLVGVRALRGAARAFTIDVSCSDVAGNTTSGQTTVTIARDRRGRSAGSRSGDSR